MKLSKGTNLLDEEEILGVVSLEQDETSKLVKVGVSHLKRLVEICEKLDWPSVCLHVQKEDYPLIVTRNKDDVSGFALAPRVEED